MLKRAHNVCSLLSEEIAAVARCGGWQYDTASKHLTCTSAVFHLLDLCENSELTLRHVFAVFTPQERKSLSNTLRNLLNNRVAFELELSVLTHKRKRKWVKITGKIQCCQDKGVRLYGAVQDVTEQRRLSDTEQNYIEYLNTILNSMNDVILSVDEYFTIITANQAVEKMFGYAPEVLVGEDISFLLPEEVEGQRRCFVRDHLQPGLGFINGKELVAMKSSGKVFPIEVSVSEVVQSGQTQFVCVLRDITEKKQALDNIYQIAFFDEITHLPNAKLFEKDLRNVIAQARASGKHVYCCMLDIDNFAQLVQAFGKETGDYILRVLAGRLKKAVSAQFEVYGGLRDKFYVLLKAPFDEDHEHDLVNLITEIEWSLHTLLMKEMSLHGNPQVITTTLASAYVHGADAEYEKVVGILDFATKRAKQQGPGGRVTLERNEFNAYDRHSYISQHLASALQKKAFYLVLQPQFDGQGNIVSSEALIRWDDAKLGNISPGEFIPIAEESDIIVEIGDWVLNEACRLLSHLRKLGVVTTLSVNVSGRHIARSDFSDRLVDIIEYWRVSPGQLVLEITETTLVSGIDLVRRRIEKLSHLGFRFSIDDFGTGYSSLSYLKELPLAELKIDRYFVDEINFESDHVPIVDTIIDMAGSMGLKTVAEGIENDIQLEYLKRKGCQLFQGFYLSKPQPVTTWLERLLAMPVKKRYNV